MQRVFYNEKPEEIKYMARPDGKADAWLRANIQQVEIEQEGVTSQKWQADEAFVEGTELAQEEVKTNFFSLFTDATAVQAQLTQAVQAYMDTTVQVRNYDSIHTACTYANSTDEKFAAEGKACVAWRDAVWRKCYDILDDILNGARSSIPTAEELIAELPALEW